jgi:hypothetical protein
LIKQVAYSFFNRCGIRERLLPRSRSTQPLSPFTGPAAPRERAPSLPSARY